VLADEQLNGPTKESVDARLSLWLKAHIDKLLGPLNALGKAEDVTGIARGIAFQLVEALGVLERSKVAEEVKGLDQATRAILRKYGVRFGAYHIYLPALLKPAPRTLGLLLWALKNGGLDQKGCDDLPGLAASGRTSIPIDPEISKNLYRMVGYRVCGNRAIRVDILERLADLIRPALSWRPAVPGEKPAGAFDGRGFTVTVAMTSLAGCSGEDFASILRSLGYRLDRRPPLPPVPAPAETKTEDAGTPTDAASPAADAPAVSESAPEPAAPDQAHEAVSEPADDAPSTASAHEAEPATEAQRAPPTETPIELGLGGIDPAAPLDSAVEPKRAEPVLIDVWRPGRPEGARRPPRRPKQPRREVRVPQVPAATAPQASAESAASAEVPPAAGREHRNKRDGRDGRHRRPRQPEHPRHDGPRPQQARPERPREKPIDPNSPFAALLELKARLEADQKEKG